MKEKIFKKEHVGNSKLDIAKGDDFRGLAMPNIKELLTDLRRNDRHIFAYPFIFLNKKYVVIFEDLVKIGKQIEYFSVALTFFDTTDEKRKLKTHVNSYQFKKDNNELIEFFGIKAQGRFGKNMIWQLYNALNTSTPIKYSEIDEEYKIYAVEVIDSRISGGGKGLCCYKAAYNGKKADGEQKMRTVLNTEKTRILRPMLYEEIGTKDNRISFFYREENPVDDLIIIERLFASKKYREAK